MSPNEQLIHTFYSAFAQRDYKTMQACYADNATFSDEAFVGLNAAEVRAMWEMLCKNGKDFRLEFKNIKSFGNTASAEWTAWYTFSATGRPVENRIKASFTLADGKITAHTDYFPFHTWAKQALGLPGLLLGWTSFFKHKVQAKARKNLQQFMQKQQSSGSL